ncbi:MAG TPA: NB-ARC domain-containing protein [Ktedonobacteraceae bacterium]
MKRYSYGERDYAFGQLIATLRRQFKLTQAELAEQLGVSRQAVGEWEAGSSYPKADHLKDFIGLGVQQHAFTTGREVEEIRTLWQAAHQKVLIDESWLQELLSQRHRRLTLVAKEQDEPSSTVKQALIQSTAEPRVDWGDALDVSSFYGRGEELAQLSQWIVTERCRVVSVLGLGGIGKSVVATSVMHQVAAHFEVVIWRSLRNAPACSALLDEFLQMITPEALRDLSAGFEQRLTLLLEGLRQTRVLLVLDNLETLLEGNTDTGQMRSGYEDYAQLLRRVAETVHQSCLLLTSREKPIALAPLEGSRAPVRALRLSPLEIAACQQLLAEKEVMGDPSEQRRLIEAYGGNPLALKIVAQTLVELFWSQIAPFLEQGEIVFGGVRELLAEQFARLSGVEQRMLLWLAVLREPVSLEELLAVQAMPLPRATLLEAVEALRRHSLVEQGHSPGSFTLQSVVLEFATARLIAEATSEIQQGQLSRLIEQSLIHARSSAYVRQAQVRLMVVPLLLQLRSAYPERMDLEEHLLVLLERLHVRADFAQGYGPTNVLALLREQRGHLRGLDLSGLSLRGAYLQGIEMQDTTLSGATLQECAWTLTFGAIWAVAISHDGRYWAAGSRRGEIWVWDQQILHRSWQAHTDIVPFLSFSPDGRTLASGSYDGMVKVWEVERGALLWSGLHTSNISGLAYSHDSNIVASGGRDAAVRLWDAKTGTLLETLSHPPAVFSITCTWSPDGRLLACSGSDGQIWLWKREKTGPATCIAVLEGHTNRGTGQAFSPDGRLLASANWDHTIKLWEVASGNVLQTLVGHTDRVETIAWSPDGRTLASAAFDQTIWLWDVERNSYRTALRGHTDVVFSLAFMPNNRRLLSGSRDGTLRVWDTESGKCEQILQGYTVSLYGLAWSPDGAQLASGGSDGLMSIWDVEGLTSPRLLHAHHLLTFGVGWSPDGRWLASSGWDNTVQVWDATTGIRVRMMKDPDDACTSFYGIAWSPDGKFLACSNNRQEIQVWQASTGTRQWVAREQPIIARRVAWSPDGTLLVGAGDDGNLSVWSPSNGRLLKQLRGHQGKVNDVAWSRDGKWLASGGGSQDSGEVFVWEIRSWERVQVLSGHLGIVYAVAWSHTGAVLVSGSSDGMLRWWDRHSGECARACQAHHGAVQQLQVSPDGKWLASCGNDGAIHLWDFEDGNLLRTLRRDRPYERLDISGVKGLTQAQRASLFALGAIEHPPVSDI